MDSASYRQQTKKACNNVTKRTIKYEQLTIHTRTSLNPSKLGYACRFQRILNECAELHLVLALLMKQFPQVVQAAGDRALVGMRVFQVLIRDVRTSVEGSLGLFDIPLGDQNDAHVQVCSCEKQDTSNRLIRLVKIVK